MTARTLKNVLPYPLVYILPIGIGIGEFFSSKYKIKVYTYLSKENLHYNEIKF